MMSTEFFQQIFDDLYQSIYVLLGGSLDDGVVSLTERGVTFLSIGIKVLFLLVFIGFIYWLLVYAVKHIMPLLRMSQRQIWIVRAVLRYGWFVVSGIVVMNEIGISPQTVRATAKAATWGGFYYILWAMSGQMLASVLKHYDLNASIEQLLKNLILVMIVLLVIATILAQFGFDLVSIVAGLGIVGVAVGFAAQSTLANFIAGITILIEQSFQVGDWIQLGEREGRIVKISLRATQILDRDNIITIIPNSTISSSEVVNLTSKKMIRFWVKIRIPLNENVDKARKILLDALKQDEVILKHPAPMVTIDEIGEYAVHFIVRFWVVPATVVRIPVVKEQITERLKNALDENGIITPYPHMKVFLPKEVEDKD